MRASNEGRVEGRAARAGASGLQSERGFLEASGEVLQRTNARFFSWIETSARRFLPGRAEKRGAATVLWTRLAFPFAMLADSLAALVRAFGGRGCERAHSQSAARTAHRPKVKQPPSAMIILLRQWPRFSWPWREGDRSKRARSMAGSPEIIPKKHRPARPTIAVALAMMGGRTARTPIP